MNKEKLYTWHRERTGALSDLLESVGKVDSYPMAVFLEKIDKSAHEYAKRQAIEFDKWIRLNYTWEKWLITDTENAYKLFIQEQKNGN